MTRKSTIHTFEIERITDYVRCCKYAAKPNPVAQESADYLVDIGYSDQDKIPMYINQPMDARLVLDGDIYKVSVRPKGYKLPWEEIGIIDRSFTLDESIKNRIDDCVEFTGGTIMVLNEGMTKNSLVKTFEPFQFIYKIEASLDF